MRENYAESPQRASCDPEIHRLRLTLELLLETLTGFHGAIQARDMPLSEVLDVLVQLDEAAL